MLQPEPRTATANWSVNSRRQGRTDRRNVKQLLGVSDTFFGGDPRLSDGGVRRSPLQRRWPSAEAPVVRTHANADLLRLQRSEHAAGSFVESRGYAVLLLLGELFCIGGPIISSEAEEPDANQERSLGIGPRRSPSDSSARDPTAPGIASGGVVLFAGSRESCRREQ